MKREKVTIKDLLKQKLTEDEIKLVPSSWDLVGDILIFVDFNENIIKHEEFIGECFLKFFKNIKVVARKTGIYSGEFRTPKLKIIAGENRTETIHKENNIRLKIDVEKVYFSTRSGNERLRISNQIKEGEDVLVMFSGAAPFVCVIAKNTKAKSVTGIELNPIGHKYGQENVKLNKLTNVNLINGDVVEEVPKLKHTFDRILMPLPKSAEDFLDTALLASKKGTIIHFYDFLNENDFDQAKQKIDKVCKKNNIDYKIQDLVKCGQFGPGIFRISVDFQVL